MKGRNVQASEVCDMPCGRVPMELSDVLAPGLDSGAVNLMKCFYMGEMEHGGGR